MLIVWVSFKHMTKMKTKKAKGTKKCVRKRKLKFGDYKNCLEATQLENTISQLEKTKFMQQKDYEDLQAKNIMYLLKKLT